jgi:hypothetical protein
MLRRIVPVVILVFGGILITAMGCSPGRDGSLPLAIPPEANAPVVLIKGPVETVNLRLWLPEAIMRKNGAFVGHPHGAR